VPERPRHAANGGAVVPETVPYLPVGHINICLFAVVRQTNDRRLCGLFPSFNTLLQYILQTRADVTLPHTLPTCGQRGVARHVYTLCQRAALRGAPTGGTAPPPPPAWTACCCRYHVHFRIAPLSFFHEPPYSGGRLHMTEELEGILQRTGVSIKGHSVCTVLATLDGRVYFQWGMRVTLTLCCLVGMNVWIYILC